MALPNGKWYDEATLEEMHADLKTEYLKTLAVISNRPSLLKHFHSCPECQTVKTAQEASDAQGSVQVEAHRRRKLVLRYSELHAVLGLKPEQSIIALETVQDPMSLSVILTGPEEPVIPVFAEAPVSVLTVEAA